MDNLNQTSFEPEGAAATQAQRGRLMDDLATPPLTLGLGDLAGQWMRECFRFAAPRPAGLQDYPEFSSRMRGAFGAALARQPLPLTATGRPRPHAWHVLFAPLGADAPRPFVVHAWCAGERVIVDLVLFGAAVGWRDEAAAAMLDALQGGIALGADVRLRVPVVPDEVIHTRAGFCDAPENATYARLTFRAPVALRQRDVVHAAPAALLRGSLRRIAAMAPWQGLRLVCDHQRIHQIIATLDVDEDNWRPYAWQRHSRRQGDTPIPMRGWLGSLTLRGDLREFATVLALAETCNIGSHAGLGLGWFDLVMV